MAPQINISEWYLKRLATVHDNQDVASQTIREMASELLSLRQQIAQRQAPTVEPAMLNTCLAFDKQEPAQAVPVAWKHDCAALLTNGVELWIDACPHCGKPRTAPPAIDDETKRMVLELCDATQEHVCVWTYPYGKQTLELAKKIRERLEAGNGE